MSSVFNRTRSIRYLSVLLICAVALAGGCRLGLQDDEEEEQAQDDFLQRLNGTWQTQCRFIDIDNDDGEDDYWEEVQYEFDSNQVSWRLEEHPESTCSEADVAILYEGTVTIGAEVDGEDGQTARRVDFRYDSGDVVEGSADRERVPFRIYDILQLDDSDREFFLGDRSAEGEDGSSSSARPGSLNFNVRYDKTFSSAPEIIKR